jgi:hypothetical protein
LKGVTFNMVTVEASNSGQGLSIQYAALGGSRNSFVLEDVALEDIKNLVDQKWWITGKVVENASDNVHVGENFALGPFILVPQMGQQVAYRSGAHTGFLVMLCYALLLAQAYITPEDLGLKREISLAIHSSRVCTLIKACKLCEQAQCRGDDGVFIGSSRGTAHETACYSWLQYRLRQESAVLGELTVAGEDLEEQRQHGCDLGQDGLKVGFGSIVPRLYEMLQESAILIISPPPFLGIEIVAENGTAAGKVVWFCRVQDRVEKAFEQTQACAD